MITYNLSIIVPIYNTSQYLPECIDSILNQTYQNFEVILINNGSTDNSGEICDKYAETDSRIKVIHKKNGGQSSARNMGLDIASGEYITFVDSDDMLSLNTLSSNMYLLNNNNNIDILQYPISKNIKSLSNSNHSTKFEVVIERTESLYQAWLQNKTITNYVCNKIFKRNIFNNLRFKEGIYYEDRHLMCDILAKCNKLAISYNGCYFYRTHEQQNTQQKYSEKILNSLITADLHIVESVKSYASLNGIQIERYTNCLYYLDLLKKNAWELNNEGGVKNINNLIPNIKTIILSQAPIGLKLKCLRKKINL